MFFSDSTSSQSVSRQRRLAADEKQRDERVVNATTVREEGAVRVAGETPTRGEVDRFRALMQSRGNANEADPKSDSSDVGASRQDADATPVATPASSSMSPNMASRFRALLQRATHTPQEQESPRAGLSREEQAPTQVAQEKGGNVRAKPQAAAKPPGQSVPSGDQVASTQSQGDEKPAQTTAPKSDVAATKQDEKPRPESADSRDGSDAESAQRIAQKAARGEVVVRPVARKTHGDDASGNDNSGGTAACSLVASAPLGMPADMATAQPQRIPEGPQQAAASAGLVAPALAELLQKHVKQMLVTDTRGSRAHSREVLLRMQSDVLPGTDLWLTRTDSGWQLRADVRSRDAYDTLLANQDDLIQRFADSALGELSIDPIYHGDTTGSGAAANASSSRPGGRQPSYK